MGYLIILFGWRVYSSYTTWYLSTHSPTCSSKNDTSSIAHRTFRQEYIDRLEDYLNNFTLSAAQTFLRFPPQTGWAAILVQIDQVRMRLLRSIQLRRQD